MIDNFLNRITMYRLVLYYLIVLLAVALIYGLIGMLPYTWLALTTSVAVILFTSLVANYIFANAYGATTNSESVYITALILALIINPVPPVNVSGYGLMIFASIWAVASKYIFAIKKKHIFNPAAFGVALPALLFGASATWWVGNVPMLAFVLIGGLLIVRKIRRFDLFLSFSIVALVTVYLTTAGTSLITPFRQTILHSSFLFLGLVMLTEPFTMPPYRWQRVLYGAIVGFLFAPNVHIGPFYLTPEIALLMGNLYAYIVSPKGRLMLALQSRSKLSEDTYEFAFASDKRMRFKPGQYLEWTLPHSADTRGNRRYFTIASAPGDELLRLGVKFYQPASSFKMALAGMLTGDMLSATHLSGEFVMPKDKNKKLAFIAGGIGVTPFRSMVSHMLATGEKRNVVMLYSNKTRAEISYKNIFDEAEVKMGMKTVYAITNEKVDVNLALPSIYQGFIDAALIQKEIPDFLERTFYISGPNAMVTAFKKTLRRLGVSCFRIKTDYFPGFA